MSDADPPSELAMKSESEFNEEEEEVSWEEKRRKMPKVVDVRKVDFQHFKNRYSLTEGLEIIEVLLGHPHIDKEVSHEARRRRGRKWDFKYEKKSAGDDERKWIQRVRIQSPPILLLLSRLTGHGDDWSVDKPRTFLQPFRAFYYYLPQIKECLNILEQRWANVDEQGGGEQVTEPKTEPKADAMLSKPRKGSEDDSDFDADSNSEPGRRTSSIDPEEAVEGPIANSVTALKHVRRFAEFVEKEILPLWERALGTNQRNFRCNNLWMAFQPGELLYTPPLSDSLQGSGKPKAPASNASQIVWRLYSMAVTGNDGEYPKDTNADPGRELYLYCYCMDYTGSSYGPVDRMFTIESYEGEKDISTLSIYPMRFLKDSQEMVAKLHAQGKQFQSVIKEPHLYYDGWTLTCNPIEKPDSQKQITSEYIDSDVIVDFAEGYKANSSLYASSVGIPDFEGGDWPSGADELQIKHWADESRSELLEDVEEVTQRSELFANYLRTRHLKDFGLSNDWEVGKVSQVEEQNVCLLPRRAIVYALRQRKFVMVDVNILQKIPASQNTFDDLKIDQSHKRLVKSLVKTHFQAQNIRKQQQPRARLNQDLIRGKGSGLVILLHGVPGVGKTATAEAVSVANKKPLFTITCGDLGFTPKEVEESLMEIFRLAHTWDCVLLLDEADVFLARREVSDLNRNALVSVFLRVLEYYSGILFLTTNRVGTLDEAFKSRIHVSLYYPPLGKRQTLAIFDVNIRKLTNIEKEKEKFQHDGDVKSSKRPTLEIDRGSILAFAASHFDRNEPSERWNGRQIRNAFQIAYSLAQFDMQEALMKHLDGDHADASVEGENIGDGPHLTPFTLNYKQFKEVANAVKRFDAYLHEAIGSDMDQSYTSGLRNDYHDPSHPSNKFVYNPPTPQAQRQNYSTRNDGSQKKSDRVYRERSEDYDSSGNGYANSAPRRQRNTDRDSSQGYSQRPPSGAYQPSQQYSPPRNPGRKPQGQGAPSQQGKAQYLKQNPSPHVHTQPRSPMRQHESESFTHGMDNKDYDNDEEYEEYGNNEYSYNQEYSDHEESYADGRY